MAMTTPVWDKMVLVYRGGAHRCYCERTGFEWRHWIVPDDGGKAWVQLCICPKQEREPQKVSENVTK